MRAARLFAIFVVLSWAGLVDTPHAQQAAVAGSAATTVSDLRVDQMSNPIGIDVRSPRFGWRIDGPGRGVLQSAYQVQVARSERALAEGKDLLWDSGTVTSDESAYAPYGGPALQSGQRCFWRVRVWGSRGDASGWSAPAFWEMGLLNASDWKARWIEPDRIEDAAVSTPPALLRREFAVSGDIEQARVYVTSHGLYELAINGQRVGDAVLTPGWTSYNKWLQYQTYDVTALLKSGRNAMGVTLGDGWYRGPLSWNRTRNSYGNRLGLLLQLVVTYRGGRQDVVSSDRSWRSSTGPILMSEIYDGETYDARLEKTGWLLPGYADGTWAGVLLADVPAHTLVAPAGPPVRRISEITPVNILRTPGGDTVVDMGQNLVGWVRLKVNGAAGTTVRLRHAEVLDKDGNFYTANLRGAKQTITYTLKGGGTETFEPHFTFQGFRFVAVEGYPGTVTLDSLTGVVVHSDLAQTSAFDTSKALINQLHHNIVWGQKGNFVDVPTDCPQRDERLGWTGDAQAFSPTAAFNMNVAGFFNKWLRDLAADQLESGSVPHVIPDMLSTPKSPQAGSAGWADAAVIIPWNMYLAYGDRRVLEAQYPSMTAWVEYMRRRAGDDLIWSEDFTYGDWLAFASTSSDYPGATTGKDLIATAMFAHSTDLLQRTARVLGKADDAAKYTDLFEKIKAAFAREFVTASGRVGENTQTAYAVALQFDLLPDGLRATAAARLAQDVRQRKHLTTGFIGTPYLCHVLARYGYLAEAYQLLNREAYPSWLYPVTQGATTIWERWDGLKRDGTFQDAGMNSFNHYAYGAIGEWMYGVMGGIGIDPAVPGYKHALIQPRPGGGFTRVDVMHRTVYGRLASAWRLDDATFELAVEIPANTTATIRVPQATVGATREGGRALVVGNGITAVRQDGADVVIEAGSGNYRFTSPAPPPAAPTK